jgi:AcrR family transcriptional regulator
MSSASRVGRPRASSRDTLAEAACELFLERGYDAVSVSDITTRAGVSRSSFFNYFAAKGDVFWAGLDERIAEVSERLRADRGADATAAVREALRALADGFTPDSLALAVAQREAMGLADELVRDASLRRARLAASISDRLRRGGADALAADVAGAAYAGAVLAAVLHWAESGPGTASLSALLDEALSALGSLAA